MIKTILVLAANPKNTSHLRLDEEVREIANGLQRAKRRDEFILKPVLAARPLDVRRAMLDFKPNIVHFCGHGMGNKGITFEDNTGYAKLVGTEAITGLFELFANDVKCVVLNACYSETQAEAIIQHIDCVVGMSTEIEDTYAIEFAVAFYDALGAGESIEFAYKFGCNAIRWLGVADDKIPILKLKTKIPINSPEQLAPPPAFVVESHPNNRNNLPDREYDVFISHASEDKESFVRPLATTLARLGLYVWYDEFELKVGDSLRRKIDEGLSRSRFGIVILSKSFFSKEWPLKELDALVSREHEGAKVILPIWHGVSKADITAFSLILADKFAIFTSEGLDKVVQEILREVKPQRIPQSFEIPGYIKQMFYNRNIPKEHIISEVQSLGFSREAATGWVSRWLNTIAHGND